MTIGIIDVVVVAALLLAAAKGALSGFLRELFGLLIIVLSLVLAKAGYPRIIASFEGSLPPEVPTSIVATMAFIVAFLMVWATLNLVAMIGQRFIRFKESTGVGRALGAVLSSAKMLVVVSFVLAGFLYIPSNPMDLQGKVQQSSLGYPLAQMAPVLYHGFSAVLPAADGPSPFPDLSSLSSLMPDMERFQREADAVGAEDERMRNR
ncbi:CvpA family protein [Desulfurispira natronophila]|uniref:Putative membrane protein required for colicin V production n=1 Tax=Desulfurispira natronophila TaxID=682562 RepID=A0A7W8DGH8_9BACT|nr:CvpA family protein [Desulfurispira natronophila]MBB5021258.1 putative membrane protein required for colicin V production [Desulfurispira natronophila]